MTDEQILKLAKTCGFDSLAGKLTTNTYWKCEQEKLLKYVKSRNQTLSFLCNRDAGDGWFEERIGNLKIDKCPVTYTAGRRK